MKDEHMKCKLIEFETKGNREGKLIAIEEKTDIPFEIKRVFYIFDSDCDIIRGQHANRESEFILICIKGSCKIRTIWKDEVQVYELNDRRYGLYLPKMMWKDMYDFSEDAILLVLSSEHYDASEYINDMKMYQEEIICYED